jgi:hypothetical protein
MAFEVKASLHMRVCYIISCGVIECPGRHKLVMIELETCKSDVEGAKHRHVDSLRCYEIE